MVRTFDQFLQSKAAVNEALTPEQQAAAWQDALSQGVPAEQQQAFIQRSKFLDPKGIKALIANMKVSGVQRPAAAAPQAPAVPQDNIPPSPAATANLPPPMDPNEYIKRIQADRKANAQRAGQVVRGAPGVARGEPAADLGEVGDREATPAEIQAAGGRISPGGVNMVGLQPGMLYRNRAGKVMIKRSERQ